MAELTFEELTRWRDAARDNIDDEQWWIMRIQLPPRRRARVFPGSSLLHGATGQGAVLGSAAAGAITTNIVFDQQAYARTLRLYENRRGEIIRGEVKPGDWWAQVQPTGARDMPLAIVASHVGKQPHY